MNFGKKPADSLIKQVPTYHLAPNFTTRPFPDGPFELGTVVEDIKLWWPLNQGADRVPIPKGERYADPREGVSASLTKNTSGELGILARVLDRSIGGDAALKGQRHDKDVYSIQKLETVHFFPRRNYISKCLQLPDVKDSLEGSNYQEPVYLITGLKFAWGATVTMVRGRQYEGSAAIGVTAPPSIVDVDVKAWAAVAGETAMSISHTKPADFVLGIQVLKLYHKKKFLGDERVLMSKLKTRGAVLVDNDEPETTKDSDIEDNFVVAEADVVDLQGLVPQVELGVNGEEVTWIVPFETVHRIPSRS
jgi:hypothetical protein